MPEAVHITGIGAISAIGEGVPETRVSLHEERSGIGAIQLLNSIHKDEIPAAEVPVNDELLLEKVGGSDPTRYSRSTLLGSLAAREALEAADLQGADHSRTGLISATTTGGMRHTENVGGGAVRLATAGRARGSVCCRVVAYPANDCRRPVQGVISSITRCTNLPAIT